MIELLDDSVPRGSDLAPGMPGNKSAEQLREVRSKINEIINLLNGGNQCQTSNQPLSTGTFQFQQVNQSS